MDHGEKEYKSCEELERARDECNEGRIKQPEFTNKRLRERNEARTYISNVDEAIRE